MGLRILHSADWHLDSPFSGFSEGKRECLKEAQRRLPGQIADLCLREGCDLLLLAGDIFDGPYTRETAEILKAALARCGARVLIAPGNHDFLEEASPWLREAWPENVHIFSPELSFVDLPELDCRVWGAGYQSMDCEALLRDFRACGTQGYSLCVLHGDPMQLNSPYCPVNAAQVRDSDLSYLALGHIHKAGSFRAGATLCAWPGSPMGRGFDETGEKGVYLVTLSEEPELRFMSLDTPRFYDLEVDTEGETPEAVLPAGADDSFYRVTLTGSSREELSSLYSRFSHLPNLELIDRRHSAEDIWARAGEDTLEGTYFARLREKLDTQPTETVCLAAEISRKLLGGWEVKLP